MTTANLIVIGKVGKPHGVRGWVNIHSFTEPRENILNYQPWFIKQNNDWRALEVLEAQDRHKNIIARFADCNDRNDADSYVNAELAIPKDRLPALPEHEFYWSDLTGLTVTTLTGRKLGIVDHLFSTGANDVLVIKGDKDYLVPFVRGHVIKDVDLKKGTIEVDWDPDF